MIIERGDLTSLADRLGALQAVRLAMAATVLVAGAVLPDQVQLTAAAVAPFTAAYLLVAVAIEVGRRATRARGLTAVGLMLLVDGLFLGTLLAAVGGPRSGLVFLVYIHLIAVTLLTSWRTGLKLAVWHSLLMVAGYTFEVRTLAVRLFGLDHDVHMTAAQVGLGAAGFWLVALCTAGFANLAERELRRGKAELGALAAMGAAFDAARTPQEVAAVLAESVVGAFGFRRAVVVTAAEPWAVRAPSHGPLEHLQTAVDGGPGVATDEVAARAWSDRAPVLTRTLDSSSPVLAALLPDAYNVIVVPLIADGNPVGVLTVERGGRAGTMVSRATIASVGSFAAHASMALRSAWLVAEIERLARIDVLTGLANRRVFEAALQRETARAVRSGQPLSLVMIDVDHFKSVNDTLGHQAGDDVLRHVGHTLAGEGRETDLAARYGGEEFCVLLPACGPDQAVVVAERLRAAIAAADHQIPVTASAGVATLPANAGDGWALVAAADEALYEAKRSGRDRTCPSLRHNGVRLSA